jgi:hypothetical protein
VNLLEKIDSLKEAVINKDSDSTGLNLPQSSKEYDLLLNELKYIKEHNHKQDDRYTKLFEEISHLKNSLHSKESKSPDSNIVSNSIENLKNSLVTKDQENTTKSLIGAIEKLVESKNSPKDDLSSVMLNLMVSNLMNKHNDSVAPQIIPANASGYDGIIKDVMQYKIMTSLVSDSSNSHNVDDKQSQVLYNILDQVKSLSYELKIDSLNKFNDSNKQLLEVIHSIARINDKLQGQDNHSNVFNDIKKNYDIYLKSFNDDQSKVLHQIKDLSVQQSYQNNMLKELDNKVANNKVDVISMETMNAVNELKDKQDKLHKIISVVTSSKDDMYQVLLDIKNQTDHLQQLYVNENISFTSKLVNQDSLYSALLSEMKSNQDIFYTKTTEELENARAVHDKLLEAVQEQQDSVDSVSYYLHKMQQDSHDTKSLLHEIFQAIYSMKTSDLKESFKRLFVNVEDIMKNQEEVITLYKESSSDNRNVNIENNDHVRTLFNQNFSILSKLEEQQTDVLNKISNFQNVSSGSYDDLLKDIYNLLNNINTRNDVLNDFFSKYDQFDKVDSIIDFNLMNIDIKKIKDQQIELKDTLFSIGEQFKKLSSDSSNNIDGNILTTLSNNVHHLLSREDNINDNLHSFKLEIMSLLANNNQSSDLKTILDDISEKQNEVSLLKNELINLKLHLQSAEVKDNALEHSEVASISKKIEDVSQTLNNVMQDYNRQHESLLLSNKKLEETLSKDNKNVENIMKNEFDKLLNLYDKKKEVLASDNVVLPFQSMSNDISTVIPQGKKIDILANMKQIGQAINQKVDSKKEE